ncbi:tetrapyrrole biosynthesis, uroporphyrinogen III synthase [Sporodiniella umbellata]|nr:tetrapyrrole biosynthesis, uroporphyrinogen III synthase [Sporodiniella umbellata]
MERKRVWILKEEKKEDEYRRLLSEAGYQVEFVPVLDYALCNVTRLASILSLGPSQQALNGLILTSQKSVSTLNEAYALANLSHKVQAEWEQLPVYSVGPQTEHQLSQCALFAHACRAHWIQAPCAAELVQPMLERLSLSKGGPLFLAGDKRRDLIPQTLSEAGIPFQELQSYRTCAHPQLLSRLEQLQNQQARWAVYFSPSGLNFIQSTLPLSQLLHPPPHLLLAAIGPTTGDAITQLGLPLHLVAPLPDPHHLVQAMVQADHLLDSPHIA